jgi:hypothetical protein
MIRYLANAFSFIVAGLLLLAGAAIVQCWPASFWLEVRAVRVFDSHAGHDVVMAVDRIIKRDFRGEWVASIRRLEQGKWVSFCTAMGVTNYGSDSELPDPLTLQWWTYPDCHPLPVGKYQMRTSWVVLGEAFLPDKSVHADSNIFEIKP